MKRAMPVYVLAALTILAFLTTDHAGASTRDRPPDVTASSWIPLTHGLGAVIEQPLPDRYPGGQSLPSALGYFVVWRDGHWLRLDSLLLQSMALRSPPAVSKWISLDKNLKFVIERQTSGPLMQDQSSTSSALGYFVIRRSGQWLRLSPNPQGALYRGPLRPPATSTSLPISEGLRFVIEQQTPERYASPGQLPSVLGYFVSKHEGHWLRLKSIA
jgi:hypothetical protein